MNESPNNNNFVTCRTTASKLTRGQKCFALIQILYFKSKRIQICYFDRHDYTEKKAQKIIIEKKLVENIKWKLGLEGGNKKKNVEFWFFFFLFGTANFFLSCLFVGAAITIIIGIGSRSHGISSSVKQNIRHTVCAVC